MTTREAHGKRATIAALKPRIKRCTLAIMVSDKVKIVVDMVRGVFAALDDVERAQALALLTSPAGALPDAQALIVNALAAAGGRITQAAVVLGCSRRALQNHMRKLGMARGRAGRRRKILYPAHAV